MFPPVSLEVLAMGEFYWMVLNQHAPKPHGANILTRGFSMSPCFGCGGVSRAQNIYGSKKSKKTLAMAPPDPRCTIVTKIETKYVLVASLAK